ncbi:hypothetical protein AB0J63_05720 [Streptosporangium canum]|uniref:hypothetical protein n=1 Tax=Streptosporangium canum TaxID=324952 RepID=UPI00341E6498
MTVRIERQGPVTTVVLSRPEVRDAVDGPTATALGGALRDFDFAAGAGRHGGFGALRGGGGGWPQARRRAR